MEIHISYLLHSLPSPTASPKQESHGAHTLVFFFFWLWCGVTWCGISVPRPGTEPRLHWWKCQILTARPPERSHILVFFCWFSRYSFRFLMQLPIILLCSICCCFLVCFWLLPQRAEVPGSGIKPMPHQWPKSQQWQLQILNLLNHQETPKIPLWKYNHSIIIRYLKSHISSL